jgi:O-antigen ligase
MQRFKVLVFVLALTIAMGVMFQSFTGYEIFEKGQPLRDLYTLNSSMGGVLRSETPGQFLIAGALVYLLAAFAKRQLQWTFFHAILAAILAGGLLVGFGRGLWMSVILGWFLLFFFSKKSNFIRISALISVSALLLIVSAIFLKPDYVNAVANRFFSVGKELQGGSSFGRRIEENQYALQKFIESPVLGVGLGGRYKPPGAESLVWEDESRYIHNAYVRIATKTGLFGLLSVIFLVLIFWWRTATILKTCHRDQAIVFTAFWLVLTTTVFTAATQPNLAASNGIASIALALFLSEAQRVKDWPVRGRN